MTVQQLRERLNEYPDDFEIGALVIEQGHLQFLIPAETDEDDDEEEEELEETE